VEETEVAGLRGVNAVPDPVGLDEDHHGDDDEADGEYGPHDADGSGVSHVVGVVDFGGLLGWKQVHDSEQTGGQNNLCWTLQTSRKHRVVLKSSLFFTWFVKKILCYGTVSVLSRCSHVPQNTHAHICVSASALRPGSGFSTPGQHLIALLNDVT